MLEESFRPARTPNLLGLFGAATILGFGVLAILAQQRWGFGLLGIFAGALLSISPFQYLRWRQPTLTLSRVGFTVALPSLSGEPYSSGPVAWRAVLNVSIIGGTRYNPMRTILINIKNDGYLSANSQTVKIPELAVDISASQLLEKIQAHLKADQ